MSRLGQTSLEPLEPYDGKLSSTVLRGESPRKWADLLDVPPNGGTGAYHYMQVNKGGCRAELNVNDLLLHNDFTEWGATGSIPMNLSILKSGKQSLRIKIYPTSQQQTLTDITRLQVTVTYGKSPNSPIEEQVTVLDWNLPKEIIDQKLPYYETTLDFDATVPYDYTYRLDGAVDLRKVSIRRTTGIEPLYIAIATVTINLLVAVAIVLLNLYVAVSQQCFPDSSPCFISTLSGCCIFHLCGSSSSSSSYRKIKIFRNHKMVYGNYSQEGIEFWGEGYLY